MSRGSENPTKRKGVGGTGEKRNEARAAWFTRAKTTLCAYVRASLRRSPGNSRGLNMTNGTCTKEKRWESSC